MNQTTQFPTPTTDAHAPSSLDHDLGLDDPKASELSGEFVGKWSHLVSMTNWEKGRIICQWREALMGSQAALSSYSDEAWSRRVGGVSGQHVGRLRRVFERFGPSYSTYSGLYWSHFLAALDWDDAEMWLEGAVQSGWSVSQMRTTRWQTLGSDPNSKPNESDYRSQTDSEDFVPLSEVNSDADIHDGPRDTAQSGPRYDDPDFGDADDVSREPSATQNEGYDDVAPWEDLPSNPHSQESPFANLPELPLDLADAFEQFKLAIIRHRSSGWEEVSPENVTVALDALKKFAVQESAT